MNDYCLPRSIEGSTEKSFRSVTWEKLWSYYMTVDQTSWFFCGGPRQFKRSIVFILQKLEFWLDMCPISTSTCQILSINRMGDGWKWTQIRFVPTLELDAASKKPIVFLGNLVLRHPAYSNKTMFYHFLQWLYFWGVQKFLLNKVVFSLGSMSSDSVSKAKFRNVLLVLHQETGICI